MFELKNFDEWEIDVENKFGSGASEKLWLKNPQTGETGLFKFPKVKSDGNITGEYWAEKLASEIGKLIDVKCADVDIGIYKGRKGSMSYNFVNSKNKRLVESLEYIQNAFPYYNKKKLITNDTEEKYSIQMITKAMGEYLNFPQIFEMIIFDCLIGNTDRHHSNWGYLFEFFEEKSTKSDGFLITPTDYHLAPLYDNGSSLCSRIDNKDTDLIIKDKMRFEALVAGQSKSCIGWKNTRPIKHLDLLKYSKEYKKSNKEIYEKIINKIKMIEANITENSIAEIISKFDDETISPNLKKLITLFLLEKRKRMIEIVRESEEKGNE